MLYLLGWVSANETSNYTFAFLTGERVDYFVVNPECLRFARLKRSRSLRQEGEIGQLRFQHVSRQVIERLGLRLLGMQWSYFSSSKSPECLFEPKGHYPPFLLGVVGDQVYVEERNELSLIARVQPEL